MSDKHTEAINNLKRAIFDEYDRLKEEDSFKFGCHPGVSCFNKCCSDINIFLTPYDVIRLKNRLDMDSEEFLTRHTLMPIEEKQHYPVIMLKMQDNDGLTCPFVDQKTGCTVYEDRPWPCRMFPIGKASPKSEDAHPFYFKMTEDVCVGWAEDTEWTIKGWLDNQKVKEWDDHGEIFKELTLHDFFSKESLTPPQMEMFHMVAYNIDKFRSFVFNTSFLKKIVLDEETIEKIKIDDEALLLFGYDWLRFALFKEKTFEVDGDVIKLAEKKSEEK
jgi:uncharacterized protein